VATPPKQIREHGRILVVDREANVRTTLRALLMIAGCAVSVAASAATGLRLVRVWHPNLILLDPYVRGRAPLDVVRAFWRAGQRRTPLVLLGGAELRTDGGMAFMVADVLAKPFDVRDLITVVSRYVSCNGRHELP
jgi:CheY-like chemotaxis protein